MCIRDRGVVITGVDGASDAAEKRLSAGDVIVEVAQEAVSLSLIHISEPTRPY